MGIFGGIAVAFLLALAAPAASDRAVHLGDRVHGTLGTDPATSVVAFRFVPESDGRVAIHARSLDVDVRLRVAVAPETSIATDEDGGVGTDARLVLDARRGVAYRVVVDGLQEDGGGDFDLSVLPEDQDAVPAEDDPGPRIAYWEEVEKEARKRGRPFRLSTALLGKGRALVDQGRFDEATVLGREAVRLREQLLGAEHPKVADALDLLAFSRYSAGDQDEAKALYERALAIQEKALGPDARDLSVTLNDYGGMLLRVGDYDGARSAFERALAIRERTLGPDHLETAESLSNLGGLEDDLGHVERARELYERALRIREKLEGPETVDVAESLNNLAGLAQADGDLVQARALYERAVRILVPLLGEDHDFTLFATSNVANVLSDLADYAGAKALYEKTLAGFERKLGPEHPSVAIAVNNLALVYQELGAYADALPLYERALAINRKVFGDGLETALSLQNLGALHQRMRRYDEAIDFFRRALAIREQVLGAEDRSVALTLESLGTTLHDASRCAEATPILERSLAIREKVLPPGHPQIANTLASLALCARDSGKPAEARRLLERALSILEAALGPDHPDTARCRMQLVTVLSKLGARGEALRQALLAEEAERAHLRRTASVVPERLALSLGELHAKGLALAVGAAAEADGGAARSALDAVVRSRALVLDEVASRNRYLHERADPTLAPLHDALGNAREKLSGLSVRGPSAKSPATYRAQLDAARGEVDRAEAALAKASVRFREELRRDDIDVAAVSAALPAGSALVAYVRSLRDPSEKEGWDVVPSYVAFVLRAGAPAPSVVKLQSAKEIDGAVDAWRRSVLAAATTVGEAGRHLEELIWSRVAPKLEGARLVFVVPDGSLHLVNLAALPASGSRYLLETGPRFHDLSAERDLVAAAPLPGARGGLLAMGGPAYEASDGEKTSPGHEVFRGAAPDCADFHTYRFPPLPAAADEAREVAELWRRADPRAAVTALTSGEATEAAFKRLAPGRRIVHVATHGFFLGGMCSAAPAGTRGFGALVGEPAPTTSNPLTLSGLAFAGANRRTSAPADRDDGILTAEEIASLDLSSVEWAVLSACDTGLGDIRAGEGVLGLRRAFEVAGARTLILSLWPVADEPARAWMKALYTARLERGASTADAVAEASRSVLEERRRKKQSTSPFYWAAFVAAGDWR